MINSDISGYIMIVMQPGIVTGVLIVLRKGETKTIIRYHIEKYSGNVYEFITEKVAELRKK